MRNKIVLILLLLIFPAAASGQGAIDFKQATDSYLLIEGMKLADGLVYTTVTGNAFSLTFTKFDGTERTWTPTAGTTTTPADDTCTNFTKGVWCKIRDNELDQLGKAKITWTCTGCVQGSQNLTVRSAAAWACPIDGDCLDIDLITAETDAIRNDTSTILNQTGTSGVLISQGTAPGQISCTAGICNTAVASVAANALTAASTAADYVTELQAGLATATALTAVDDFVDTEVAAIQTGVTTIAGQTDDIGVAGAGLTALASQASVTAVDDFVDTEIAALTTALTAVENQTDDIGVAGAGLTAVPLRTIVKNTAWVAYVTMFTATGQRDTALTAGGMICVMDLDGADSPVTVTGTKTEVDDTSMPGVWIVGVPAGTMNFDSGAMVCRSGTSYGGANIQPQR